jgi:HlyD family secretion protein
MRAIIFSVVQSLSIDRYLSYDRQFALGSRAVPGAHAVDFGGGALVKKRWVPIAIVAAIAAGLAWWLTHRHAVRTELVLYGDIDLRQVDLAFHDSERIAAVYVQEGDRVRRGQILARLDESRLLPQLAQAQSAAAAQRAVVERMHHGNRPQEIAEARANVALEEADSYDAVRKYQRLLTLSQASGGRAVSRQDLDDAKAAADVAEARLNVNRKALSLEVLGPRREDVDQAEAQLRADQAQAALLCQMVADAELRAPMDSVVRSRIAEPGDMASPQTTAFTLAITDPKWVRTYLPEPDLGLVRPGIRATLAFDAFPHQRFDGWVGFISPVAEFTPKTVETPDLRSSLVYEVRVFVRDPEDVLRLGMPATVYLPLGGAGASMGGANGSAGRVELGGAPQLGGVPEGAERPQPANPPFSSAASCGPTAVAQSAAP